MGKLKQLNMTFGGKNYENYRKKCLYKHIDENHIKATQGKLLILSGFSGVGKGTVIQQLLTEYPESMSYLYQLQQESQGKAKWMENLIILRSEKNLKI